MGYGPARRRTRAPINMLIETCKMNGVGPYAWMRSTLEKIARDHPQSKIQEMLPWNLEPEAN